MKECASGYCIVLSTTKCEIMTQSFTPKRIGKEKTTHLCQDVNGAGSNGVIECLGGFFCMLNVGTVNAQCVALAVTPTGRVGREKLT